MSILHWLLKRVMIHPVLGSEKSWPILHWVLGGGVTVCFTLPPGDHGLSHTGSWSVMVCPALATEELWPIL